MRTGSAIGDKLDEAWPARSAIGQALAEDSLPCWRHKRPAVLVCVRCHAPYCNKCRAKPFSKQFFLCRRCQAGMYNRRFVALILDDLVFFYVPVIAGGRPVGDDPRRRRPSWRSSSTLLSSSGSASSSCATRSFAAPGSASVSCGLAGRAVEGRKDAAHLRPGSSCAG